jgi:hypothetical protein
MSDITCDVDAGGSIRCGFRSASLPGGGARKEVGDTCHQYSGGLMVLEDVDPDATGGECMFEDELALLAYQDNDMRAKLSENRKSEARKRAPGACWAVDTRSANCQLGMTSPRSSITGTDHHSTPKS